jgi:hypothetical protein
VKKLILILLCCSAASGTILINSFNSGQLSKDLKYRADLEQHEMASETMTNVLVRPQGMGYRRPGTEYIDTKRTTTITPAVGAYPTLRAATDQADPGLTQTTPISNLTELENMANDLTGNYYLTGDIDASATSGGAYNGGKGWEPIGPSYPTQEFEGTFDGCGYTISDLYINDNTEINVGLFGTTGTSAVIANVTLSNVDITGNRYVGALVGNVWQTDVYNCHSTGTVTLAGTTPYGIGGIVGYAGNAAGAGDADFYDCTTSCTIAGGSGNDVGGFIGLTTNDFYAHNCSASGAVSSTGDGVGGFLGDAVAVTPNCDDSSATGDVTGGNDVGGFVGNAGGGLFERCSATGDVTASDSDGEAGGFSGDGGLQFTDCYAWGDVTGGATTGYAGGFSGDGGTNYYQCYSIGTTTANTDGGFSANTGSMNDVFWDTESSGDSTSSGTANAPQVFEGHVTSWMQTEANYPDTPSGKCSRRRKAVSIPATPFALSPSSTRSVTPTYWNLGILILAF